eukprot:scaffold20763_cov29-Prasinocladus_malaysianus.AAC.2
MDITFVAISTHFADANRKLFLGHQLVVTAFLWASGEIVPVYDGNATSSMSSEEFLGLVIKSTGLGDSFADPTEASVLGNQTLAGSNQTMSDPGVYATASFGPADGTPLPHSIDAQMPHPKNTVLEFCHFWHTLIVICAANCLRRLRHGSDVPLRAAVAQGPL